MKFGGDSFVVADSCLFLCNKFVDDQLLLASGVAGGVNLSEKRGSNSNLDGEQRRLPLCVSIDKLADWSYLSHLSLFLAPESKKLYILVDNRPWLKDLVSRPTHLWQLMVTKSRMSPFANTRGRKGRKETADSPEIEVTSDLKASGSEEMKKWFSLVDATILSRKRALLPVEKLRNTLILNSKLHRTLYGFIVFEVAWSDVRGMNYLNELQTDTSVAVETKFMQRWEFDSISQATKCLSSWFPGTLNEQILLKEFLDSTTGEGFYDAQDNFPRTSDVEDNDDTDSDGVCREDEFPSCLNPSFGVYSATIETNTSSLQTPPPPDGPYKRRKVMKSFSTKAEIDMHSGEEPNDNVESPIYSQSSYDSDCEDVTAASQYRDVLILFRFNDPDLPFKLKVIIMADLRLLTLLESGLPSWVLFLQSYPGFCHLYRPWMCPLARALYVLISIVTVLIGFYDLYKNVPLLKATASGLFGPLFDWIETWEMISRIKYLGTMLFLHNFQKAIQWFLMMTRSVRSFLSIFMGPMTGPFLGFLDFFLPLWTACLELTGSLFSAIWIVFEFSYSIVGDLIEMLLLPIWYLLSFIWSIVITIVYPIFWILWEILYAPIRLALGLSNLVAFFCTCTYDLIGDIWSFVSGIFVFGSQVSKVAPTVKSYEVSMWRSLWNDLFSQVFKAVRSILNGLVAFLVACNRHRLSIYNHSLEFIRRLSESRKTSQSSNSELERQPSVALIKLESWEDGTPSMKKIR